MTRPVLLLDAGNSRAKWRLRRARRDVEGCCAARELSAPAAWRVPCAPRRVVASVVRGDDARRVLRAACADLWGLEPEFAAVAGEAHGVVNGYRNPAELGVDRWLSLLAARRLCRGDAVIVDCGTAITVDLLRADGRHDGGAVLPGLRALSGALARRAPRLEVVDAREDGADAEFPPRGTRAALALGARLCALAAVDRFIERCAASAASAPQVLVTGGDGPWVAPRLSCPASSHRNLVLDGLEILMERGP